MMKKLILVMLAISWLLIPFEVYAEEEPYDFLETGITTLLESNLFTRVEDLTPYTQQVMDLSSFEEIMQNDRFTVYVNPSGLALRIVDRSNGFIWASDIDDLDDYPLNAAWIRRIRSAITIDYINENSIAITSSILQRRSNENALTSYQVNGNTTHFDVDFHIEQIRFSYEVELTDDGIIVKVDRDSIEEYGTSRLTKLSVFEFFGTVYSDNVPGYFFVPSGNGALIRFTNTSTINSVYRARFYSQDKYRSALGGESTLNYPVFGSVHGVNQHALFTEIIEGAEFAEYIYTPPTYQTEFHSQNATFLMRENHVQPLSGTETLTIYETDIKDYHPTVRYTILNDEDANYIGFANTLKTNMIASGILEKAYAPQEVMMHLDVLMKEYEKGLIFKKPYIMTSVDALLSIDDELTEAGVDRIQYTLRGYNRGGYSDRSFTNYKLDRSIGRFQDLEDLDVEYYYDPTVSYSYRQQPSSSTLQMVTRKYFIESVNRGEYYRFIHDIDRIAEVFPEAYDTLSARGGMALDGLSNDLNSNATRSRSDVIELYDTLFEERMSMYRPDFYNIQYASQIYMSSLYHNRSRFFTDSVPFEQIVLSGYIPVYSQFLNFSSNIHVDLLKIIEFGIFPAFLITSEPSYLLSDTMSRDYYATYYGNLKEYMIEAYMDNQQALKEVVGHSIIWREVLRSGVIRIDYDNGYAIYVNYTNSPFIDGSIIIEPFGFNVIEVTP